MNIDANAGSSPPSPVQKPGANSVRSRASGDAGSEGTGSASFLSMLHALTVPAAVADGSAPSGKPDQDTGSEDGKDAMGDSRAGLRTPSESSAVATGPVASAPGPAVPAPAQLGSAHAGLRRGPGQAADTAAHRALADAAKLAEDAADLTDPGPKGTDLEPGARSANQPSGAATAEFDRLARQQAAEASALARDGSGRPEASAKESETAQWRALVAPQSGNGAASSVVSMFEAGLAGLRAGPGIREHQRGANRIQLPDAPSAGFVAWSDAAPGSNAAQPASPVYAPTASTPVPSAALAQKMHYWVAGGVQSAELQLDAFDGGAVDVRIAVRGNEAFVEFRSDQPQARKLLLDAMPQLQELLAGEGLMLSGGFVGGSAQHPDDGGSARSDRFARARAAPARMQEVAIVPATATATRQGSGRAVDLFV